MVPKALHLNVPPLKTIACQFFLHFMDGRGLGITLYNFAIKIYTCILYFSHSNDNQIWLFKSVDGVIGIQTRDRRIVGADPLIWQPWYKFVIIQYSICCPIIYVLLSYPFCYNVLQLAFTHDAMLIAFKHEPFPVSFSTFSSFQRLTVNTGFEP